LPINIAAFIVLEQAPVPGGMLGAGAAGTRTTYWPAPSCGTGSRPAWPARRCSASPEREQELSS
jgi:hypothetical protein